MTYLVAQTQIDLHTQAKRVDFSNASSTKPSKTGTVLPGACSVGETFVKTDAAAGANLYVCTAPNIWTVQGGTLPEYGVGSYGKVLANDEAGMQWESLGGDISGPPDELTVTKLQGRPVASSTPATGHVLSWDGTQWVPQTLGAGSIAGLAGSATSDTTNAANITSGVLQNARLSAVPNSSLANSSVTVSAGNGLSGGGAVALGGSTTLNSAVTINSQAGTTYTFVAGDGGKFVAFNNAAAVSVVLPQATGSFGAGWYVRVRNLGTGAVTITPVTSTIDGSASVVLQSGQGLLIASDGANYQTWRGYSWQASSGASHQFATGISAAGSVSYAQPAAADISGLAASATTDATNAANITSGVLANARLSAVPNSSLANSSVTVSAGNGLSGGGAVALGGSTTLNSAVTINSQAGTTYTFVAGDGGKFVTFSNASAVGVVLPQATGSFGSGWYVRVRNLGTGAVTITPATSTIDGSANVVLQTGQGLLIASDGANYQTWRGYGWQASSGASHQFATGISAAGVVSYAQPAAADISGLALSATTDTTNASNIASGTLGAGRLPQFTGGDVTTSAPGSAILTLATVNSTPGACGDSTHVCQVTTNAKGLVTSQSAVAVSGGGSGLTSLNGLTGNNQTFVNDANVTISSAGTTHTLGWNGLLGLGRGGTAADLSSTGGLHQVLRQSGAGAAVTVSQLAAADISGLASSATTDTTNAANITSGVLPNARLSAVPNSSLANSSVTVSAGTGLSGGGAVALGGSTTLNSAVTINSQTGTMYTFVAGDGGKFVTFNNASAVIVVLPQATGSFGSGWYVRVRNLGTGAATITPATSTVDGSANVVLQTGQGLLIVSDGTNYQTWRGYGWQASSGASHQFATGISALGVVSYAQPAAADISGLASSATTDTTNAVNITSGVLPNARLSAVPNSSLANSSVTVSAGTGLSGGGAVALGGSTTLNSAVIINSQIGTTYTFVAGDGGKFVTFNNTSAVSAQLPQATGSFGAGWYVHVRNLGAGAATITPTTSTIDGSANVVLQTGQGLLIASDGTNYQTWRGYGWQSSSGASHQFATGISALGVVSYAQPAAADISGLAASATSDTTNAANITSGVLPNARLSAVPNSSLANSSVTVSAGNGLSGGGAVALGGSTTLNSAVTINSQAGTTYTFVAGDGGKFVTFSNASAVSVVLPQATGSFGSGWYVRVRNLGTGAVTITPATSTIDGSANVVLQTGQGLLIASDGTNYQTWRGYGWQSSSGASHQFATGISALGVVSYAQPAAADISGLASSATTDTTNAVNITSGVLPNARLSAVPNSSLANSSVTVSAGNGLSGGGAVALGGSTTLNSAVIINSQIGTTYTFVAGDGGKFVTFNNASAVGAQVPQATGSFGAGWYVHVRNLGAGAATITPTTSTIDGSASVVLQTGQGLLIVSDGTNYQTWRGYGWQSSSGASHQFATGISALGVVSYAQPAAADISGLAASATTDTTNASNIASGNLSAGRLPQFTGGDVTTSAPGSGTLTLATVNSSPGACGDGTHVCQVTTNGKGLVTGQSAVLITSAGSGVANMTTGSGAPPGSCTAPSANNISLYTDTSASELWACVAANTWNKLLATANSGNYVESGATGAAPSRPSAGNLKCYFSSASNTQLCLGSSASMDSGTVVTKASRDANKFVAYVDGNGVQQTVQPDWSDLTNKPAGFAPTAHAASHQNGGADEVATAAPAANAIPKADGSGKLASGWMPAPGASTLGGITAAKCSAGTHVDGYNTDGSPHCTADSGGGGSGVGRASLSATWGAIVDGACQEQTVTWTGIGASDTVNLGLPSALPAGLLVNARVTAASTVTIRICNLSGATVTPGLQSFAATLAVYNLSGTGTATFASAIPDGACGDATFSLNGLSAGDPVVPQWPANFGSGLFGSMIATAANTVDVRVCNLSGAPVTPTAIYGASVAK